MPTESLHKIEDQPTLHDDVAAWLMRLIAISQAQGSIEKAQLIQRISLIETLKNSPFSSFRLLAKQLDTVVSKLQVIDRGSGTADDPFHYGGSLFQQVNKALQLSTSDDNVYLEVKGIVLCIKLSEWDIQPRDTDLSPPDQVRAQRYISEIVETLVLLSEQ